jgi:hypothetical protein
MNSTAVNGNAIQAQIHRQQLDQMREQPIERSCRLAIP